MNVLKKKIKAAMIECNMEYQHQLASASGITEWKLSMIMSDKRRMNAERWEKEAIAKALKKKVKELF